ncbi:hypothetical protein GPALN_006454 [Globodera pallida]|nr:hypothetical protein GPALN_006454 [Globodera pallida]
MLGINEFEIYQGNRTDTLHSNYVYKYSLPFERIQDKVAWTIFFQQHWHHSITVSVLYYAFVRLVQHLMRNRPPFSLRSPLLLWNAALALFSVIGLLRFSEDFGHNLFNNGITYSLCHSCNPDSVAAFWSLLFAVSKLVELGDTLFIVLRKRPLIFLHYYHHVAVLVYTVHSGTEHTAPGQAFISMNFLAHSVMYTYYALTVYGLKLPRWVAMSVTIIQTTQMFLGVAVSLTVLKLKMLDGISCQQSVANLYLAFTIYITFAFLFVQFFVEAYLSKERKKKVL